MNKMPRISTLSNAFDVNIEHEMHLNWCEYGLLSRRDHRSAVAYPFAITHTRFNCVFIILCNSFRMMLSFIIVSELKIERPNARPG